MIIVENIFANSKYYDIILMYFAELKLFRLKGGGEMEITDIRVRKLNREGKMKAIVSVTFDDCFVLHDIKVIEGREKLFIAMPSRKTPSGEYKDIAHPINQETREFIQNEILARYEESLSESSEENDEE